MKTYLAQVTLPDGTTIENPPGFKTDVFTNPAAIVNAAIPYVISIAGIVLLTYLVWGGFDFLTAMGDSKKATAGRGKITNAILGFIVIFVAYWIVQIIDYLFKLGVYS